MPEVFIIHGSYSHPEENWFPWLKSELEKEESRGERKVQEQNHSG